MNAAARLQAVLYGPTSAQLLEPLPAVADVVQERIDAITAAPTVADVDALLRDLGGLTGMLMRLRVVLVNEEGCDG